VYEKITCSLNQSKNFGPDCTPRLFFQPFNLKSRRCWSVGAIWLFHCSLSKCLHEQNSGYAYIIKNLEQNKNDVFGKTYVKKASISGMFVNMYRKLTLYSLFESSRTLLGLMQRPGHLKMSRSQVP
jgi:hypothetical protein